MRPGKGCESCRERHLKCVTKPDSKDGKCTRCIEGERTCLFGPKFRFKQVEHLDSGANGSRYRQALTFDKSQIWLNTRKSYSFILEDGNGLEYGVPDDEDVDIATASAYTSRPPAGDLPRRALPISSILDPKPDAQKEPTNSDSCKSASEPMQGLESPRGNGIPPSDPLSAAWQLRDVVLSHTATSHSSSTPRPVTAIVPHSYTPEFSTPAAIVDLQRRHEDGLGVLTPSAVSYPSGITGEAFPASLPTPGAVPRPSLSRREAYLIQHFINKIGPWMDVCDAQMHFTHELPRQAMARPMVLYALLALTSRHLAVLARQTPQLAESGFYHGLCLKFVIEQLSGPDALYDGALIATVVCLRMYEEIDFNNDEAYHLAGTDRLMRAMPTFAYSGGLGEAACWQSLRQDIYLSMARCIPPSFPLETFELSSVFTFKNDGACANVIILMFAKILRLVHTEAEQNNHAAWDHLARDVEAWHDRRLRIFQPMYYEDSDTAQDRPFPIVHCITPPQVAALQYYHACHVFMSLFRPQNVSATSGFHASRNRRSVEREVTSHLAALVGLAEHNPFVENARFTAAHVLRVGGYCITNNLQRTRVIQFLENVEDSMGWLTSHTVALLKEQWQDLDGLED